MKDRLLKLLALKQAELKAAQKRSENSEDPAELRGILDSVSTLKEEIREYENMIAEIEAEEARGAQNDDPAAAEARGAADGEEGQAEARGQNMMLGSFQQGGQAAGDAEARAKALELLEEQGANLRQKA